MARDEAANPPMENPVTSTFPPGSSAANSAKETAVDVHTEPSTSDQARPLAHASPRARVPGSGACTQHSVGHIMSSRRIATVPAILVCYRRAECWGCLCRCGDACDEWAAPVDARCPSKSVKHPPAERWPSVERYKHMSIRNFPRLR